jgi:hypothetical protein
VLQGMVILRKYEDSFRLYFNCHNEYKPFVDAMNTVDRGFPDRARFEWLTQLSGRYPDLIKVEGRNDESSFEEWSVSLSINLHDHNLDMFHYQFRYNFEDCSLGMMNCGYINDYELSEVNDVNEIVHGKDFIEISSQEVHMVQTVVDSLFHSFGSTESCGFMVKEQLVDVVQDATDQVETVTITSINLDSDDEREGAKEMCFDVGRVLPLFSTKCVM